MKRSVFLPMLGTRNQCSGSESKRKSYLVGAVRTERGWRTVPRRGMDEKFSVNSKSNGMLAIASTGQLSGRM